MRAPAFWQRGPEKPGVLARCLTPLGWLYAAGTKRRLAAGKPYRSAVPVICVGNINAGGTGKTPVAIALAERFAAKDRRVAVVSRGHGGKLSGPVRVDPLSHSADDVGDEPLLLAAFVPVWVARDRAAGVRQAEADGAEVIILDDGLQNPSVAKDLSLVVVDAASGFGNGLVLPAGPLREPIAAGLARSDLVVSVGGPRDQARFTKDWGGEVTLPVVQVWLQPLQTGMDWTGLKVLAFAGIGRPEKFFSTLRDLGAETVRTVALADHQPLSQALLGRLAGEARALGLQLVTTEKDAVRLPQEFRSKVLTVPVRVASDDWDMLDAAIEKMLRPE